MEDTFHMYQLFLVPCALSLIKLIGHEKKSRQTDTTLDGLIGRQIGKQLNREAKTCIGGWLHR